MDSYLKVRLVTGTDYDRHGSPDWSPDGKLIAYDAWKGTARQSPPQKGQPNPSTEYIEMGRWIPGFKAQDEMLDRHMKKYNLEEQDWRPEMYKKLEE